MNTYVELTQAGINDLKIIRQLYYSILSTPTTSYANPTTTTFLHVKNQETRLHLRQSIIVYLSCSSWRPF